MTEAFLLSRGGHLWEYPNFVQNPNLLFEHLVADVNWVTETYMMFGKPVDTPRLLSSMFDPDLITRDKKNVLHLTRKLQTGKVWKETSKWFQSGSPWTPLMKELKEDLETFLNSESQAGVLDYDKDIKFPYAQLNYYPTGNHYIGYHTDSEVTSDGLVASISLGATRRFVLRDVKAKTGEPEYEVWLDHGSLIVMDCGSIKTYYKHSLPVMRKKDYVHLSHDTLYQDKGRVNITFRMG